MQADTYLLPDEIESVAVIHAVTVLYDKNWNLIQQRSYKDLNLQNIYMRPFDVTAYYFDQMVPISPNLFPQELHKNANLEKIVGLHAQEYGQKNGIEYDFITSRKSTYNFVSTAYCYDRNTHTQRIDVWYYLLLNEKPPIFNLEHGENRIINLAAFEMFWNTSKDRFVKTFNLLLGSEIDYVRDKIITGTPQYQASQYLTKKTTFILICTDYS